MKSVLSIIILLSLNTAAVYAERPEANAEVPAMIAALVDGERPDSHKARDQYRHPLETLTFLGIDPTENVVEVFPGGQGGWYRRIIEPLVVEGGGEYFPVRGRSGWPKNQADGIPYGKIDMVFVFRAHGFLIYGEPAEDHVKDLFNMLKPGGYFGIVDHAGDEAVEQDPYGQNGYVNESYFKQMALDVGFELVKTSDINRNELDNKDHPMGVYSLPPSLRGPRRDEHAAIGESDRFTHLYRKPLK